MNRSVGSLGPTMRPGRTCATRPGQPASAARSQRAFHAPYVSLVSFSAATASAGTSATGLASSTGSRELPTAGYTLIVETSV